MDIKEFAKNIQSRELPTEAIEILKEDFYKLAEEYDIKWGSLNILNDITGATPEWMMLVYLYISLVSDEVGTQIILSDPPEHLES